MLKLFGCSGRKADDVIDVGTKRRIKAATTSALHCAASPWKTWRKMEEPDERGGAMWQQRVELQQIQRRATVNNDRLTTWCS